MKEGLKLFFLGLFKIILLLVLIVGSISAYNSTTFENTFNSYDKYIVLTFLIVLSQRIYFYIRYWRYIILPYSMSLYNRATNEQKESNVYLDKFKRYDRRSKTIYFKNRLAIDKDLYLKNKAKIIHFLGFDKDDTIEIEISVFNTKEIDIRVYKLPNSFNWHLGCLLDGYIYLGHSKDGSIFIPMQNLTSSITCGESGSGKSNYLNMIIFSLLHNFNYIDKLYFIDLKGVELSRYNLPNCDFVDNLDDVDTTLSNVKDIMNDRFKEMKEKGDLLYEGRYIICLIDEIGTISTSNNKKKKESIFNSIIEISQKGRASRVLLMIFSQKIDSTNIPTNVLTNLQTSCLFRTSSQYNINNAIGLQEEIDEITRSRVQDFKKGRLIYKDGLTSQKILLQSPFLSKEIQQSMINYFKQWIK